MSNLSKFIMLLLIGLVLTAGSIWFIGGKKKEYDVSATLNAHPSQIFPYVANPELKKEWMPGLVEQKLTGGETIDEGSELRSTVESNGEMVEFNDLVIRYVENEFISIKSRNDKMVSTSMFRLKEIGSKTEVTYRRIIRFNGFDRLKAVFAENDYQREVERDLNNLVKLVESKYPDGAVNLINDSPTAGVQSESNRKDEDDAVGDADVDQTPGTNDSSQQKESSGNDTGSSDENGGAAVIGLPANVADRQLIQAVKSQSG